MTFGRSMTPDRRVLLLLAVMAAPAPLWGATWYVAANGDDTLPCGASAADPCRSISKAIGLATAGDTVLVGPGNYGDANGDGDFADPGDEAASFGAGCFCMVHVNKAVKLLSRDGAWTTLLRADGVSNVVSVSASGAQVGDAKKGFTVSNGLGGAGVGIDVTAAASGVTVAGNIFDRLTSAISSDGTATKITLNRVLNASGDGVQLDGSSPTVSGNVVASAVVGIQTGSSSGGTFTKNVVVANRFAGITAANGATALRNAVIGNRLNGIGLGSSPGPIGENSIFGNGSGSSTPNCGLVNPQSVAFNAGGNYWGAASGPGSDPADLVGGSCDLPGPTTATPFATREIKVSVKPLR